MAEEILYRKLGNVALIRLNSPPLNLQTLSSMKMLGQAIADAGRDSSIRALVLSGEGGKVFCAGSDIKEFPKLRGNFIEEKLRYENQVFDSIAELPIPTVAAITGSALGGGLELALCCDIRIMAEKAALSTPEINLGNFPGSGGPMRLVKYVGPAFAAEMMCTARSISAPEALRRGLVTELCPPEQVTGRALELAEQIAARPPELMKAVKMLLHASQYETTAQAAIHSIDCFTEATEKQK